MQVGNAVPPPLARAIGLEIKKCLKAVPVKTGKPDPSADVDTKAKPKTVSPETGMSNGEEMEVIEAKEEVKDGETPGSSTS